MQLDALFSETAKKLIACECHFLTWRVSRPGRNSNWACPHLLPLLRAVFKWPTWLGVTVNQISKACISWLRVCRGAEGRVHACQSPVLGRPRQEDGKVRPAGAAQLDADS